MMNDIIDKLKDTLFAKSSDYGHAFSEMFDELGIDYAYGKLREKINRISLLSDKRNYHKLLSHATSMEMYGQKAFFTSF